MCESVPVKRRSARLFGAAAALATALVGQAIAEPAPAAAVGPSVTFTDPAAHTVLVGSGLRLGWKESAPTTAPIVSRRLVQFRGTLPSGGTCADASYSVSWTNVSANPARRFEIAGLSVASCYYWTVTVRDIKGASDTARSAYVRVVGGDPGAAFTFPAPGAASDGPPGPYTISWTETASQGIVERWITEQTAPMDANRSCETVSWTVIRTLMATGPYLAVGSLGAGDTVGLCYRYTLSVRDFADTVRSTQSGPLLVTTRPPSCAYGDVLTTERAYGDWWRTLLDPIYRLPAAYAPADLVSTGGISHVNSGLEIRKLAYADLKALADAARAAGTPIDLTSAYRSYGAQRITLDYYVNQLGPSRGLLRAARPGHSEHQLGTAIDVKAYLGPAPEASADWALTKTGAWLRDNAWQYGWIMSYPKASSPSAACYQYEPWHYRYIGRPMAFAVHVLGLTLREFFWRLRSLSPGT